MAGGAARVDGRGRTGAAAGAVFGPIYGGQPAHVQRFMKVRRLTMAREVMLGPLPCRRL